MAWAQVVATTSRRARVAHTHTHTGREAYAAGEEGSAQWAEQILAYADDNFNDAGIEVRSMDYRDRKVGLFGDFLERVGHGKFVEWRANEEYGGLYSHGPPLRNTTIKKL